MYLFTSFLVLIVLLVYPGNANMQELLQSADVILANPVLAAFYFGHFPTANVEGFLFLKLLTLHWIYYGPYLFI